MSQIHHRALYADFNLKNRLTGLIGARGVGKTTLMLQYIKEKLWEERDSVFYFSADHIYFSSVTLYAFVDILYSQQGDYLANDTVFEIGGRNKKE